MAGTAPLASIDGVVQAQAGIMSYFDIVWMLGILGLMIWPLALFLNGAVPAHRRPIVVGSLILDLLTLLPWHRG